MNTVILYNLRACLRHCPSPRPIVPHNGQRPLVITQSSLFCEKSSRSSSTSSIALNRQGNNKVNGPPSTLPPPLTVLDRKPDQSFPSYLLTTGKAYLAFYKAGGKAVFKNFVASRPIHATLASKYNGSLTKAIDSGFLDRSSFQLLVRSRFDITRLPIFALVFIVCGELTPLVVVALSDIVPYACRIPRQIEGDRKMLEKRRATSFQNLKAELQKDVVGVEGLNRMQLLHISQSLGLNGKVWNWLANYLPGLPTSLLRRRVRRRVKYLEIDDQLIWRCGGIQNMDAEEIRIALVERGVDILGKTEKQLQDSMEVWLHAREGAPIERLLLTRPFTWARKTH